MTFVHKKGSKESLAMVGLLSRMVLLKGELVNKSHNKTPYELFNGRSPTIGFLKPFSCHVMILNTLDHLGKFEKNRDEGYFIGYSMSSKAFWVFNKRTRRVEEKLHVEFLKNKAIEKGAGPNWLFDIDSLSKSINYVPVDEGTISTNLSGIKDTASQEVKKDVSSLRYIALPNWAHDAFLEFSLSTPQDHCSTEVPEGSENTNPTVSTSNPLADHMETLIVETPIHTVSLPVPTAYSTDSQEPSSDARLISKRVANQEDTPSLDNIISLTNRFEDILRGTTNSDESNEEEADISNMEIAITASPTPTLRIHKDHPKSQIISPMDTSIQTRNKLVAQGHTQEERIDYDEVFAPVARIEAIRLFLAYASFMAFTVYQMDVKSAFLYGTIDEEVHQVTPKECHLHTVKMIFRYLKGHPKLGLWYPKESPFDLVAYSNSNYGGATQDRKSTTEGCQFLGRRLISWQCKKQTIVATSTTEAEYVAAASCYGQVLWIQN
nr:putative ribonuclease H-like domain-containing protein [Tanacetum cinerariifolium]